jgi:hypothetical protein
VNARVTSVMMTHARHTRVTRAAVCVAAAMRGTRATAAAQLVSSASCVCALVRPPRHGLRCVGVRIVLSLRV